MRIRKRPPPPPPQIQPDPSTPHLQESHTRVDERERRRGAESSRLHHQEEQAGDLVRSLHGWWRRSDPIVSQVLQEEGKDHKKETDSDKLSIGASKRETMEGEERSMEKAQASAILMDDKKRRRLPAVMMEGSRCSRVNGRGWRCSLYTLVGYSLCEHHLGKGRLRSLSSVRAGGATKQPIKATAMEKEDEMVGVVKARSMSSLIKGPSSLISTVNHCSS